VDSGRLVGQALGLEVIETERESGAQSFEDVAEFLATGMGGEDCCYRSFASFLDKRVLLTGFHGDSIWGMHSQPNGSLIRGDLCGCSLQEFRLRRNYIHIPVPLIGARRHAEIAAISQMEEMSAYRLNNEYDRPICRRLLEECGVARELFGQEKKAASDLFFVNPASLPRPDESIRQETKVGVATRARIRVASLVWRLRYRLHRQATEGGFKFPGGWRLRRIFVREFPIFEHQHPESVMDFLNGMALTRRRYRAGLGVHRAG
jgi:hypothetical protein